MKNGNVEAAPDYGSHVVYGVSRDGKFDCRRLQFARNVKSREDCRAKIRSKFARDVGKLGERKVFISAFAKSSSSRRLSLPVLSHHQHRHSASRRLYHSKCRKTMSTYESAKEIYEVLRVPESALLVFDEWKRTNVTNVARPYYAIILLRNDLTDL